MMYDVAVVGDGVFAKIFLWELNRHIKEHEKFKVVQLHAEKIAPSCSLRTTSTVSQNGIVEGVSELGDDLYNAFICMENFFKTMNHEGIYASKQLVGSTTESSVLKLKMRYKEKVQELESPFLKQSISGVLLDSYIFSPELFFQGLEKISKKFSIDKIEQAVIHVDEKSDHAQLQLIDGTLIKARKIVLATGAYSLIFPQIFEKTDMALKIQNTKIVAGSYLKKKFIHPENIYLTINGHNLVYRKETKELIIGSTSVQGPFTVPDIFSLKQIFDEMKNIVSLDLGEFNEFEVITGLRHKGQKRRPFFKPITSEKRIWFFNGAYKNGWSLPFLYIPREIKNFL